MTPQQCQKLLKIVISGVLSQEKIFFMDETKPNEVLYLAYTLLMKNICQNPGGNTLCDYPGGPLGSNHVFRVTEIHDFGHKYRLK